MDVTVTINNEAGFRRAFVDIRAADPPTTQELAQRIITQAEETGASQLLRDSLVLMDQASDTDKQEMQAIFERIRQRR